MDKRIERKKFTLKKIVAWSVFFIGIIILYSLASGSGNAKTVEKSKIRIAEVKFDNFQEQIPVNGTVEPLRTVFLDAIQGGMVEEIFVENGSLVEKGTPLIKLSNTNMMLDFMNRETQIIEQINNLRSTRIQMELNEQNIKEQVLKIEYELADMQQQFSIDTFLYSNEVIAQKKYNESKNRYDYLNKRKKLLSDNYKKDATFREQQIEQIDRSILMMERNLNAIRKNLENLVVKAPVSGQLTSFDHEIGENKLKGQNLGRIDVMGGFRISALIDEHFLSRVHLNQTGSFLLNGHGFQLVTNKILPQVENRQFEIKMAFEDSIPENVRRGQNLSINLELSQQRKALLIPRGSYYNLTGGKWVFVVNENGIATKREIKLGRQNPDYFEVIGGLEKGEKIIVSNYQNFMEKEELILE